MVHQFAFGFSGLGFVALQGLGWMFFRAKGSWGLRVSGFRVSGFRV